MTFRIDVHLLCPNCTGWYNEHDQNIKDIAKLNEDFTTTYYCPYCDKVELHDAATYGIPTPVEELKIELLGEEIDMYKERLAELEARYEQITNTVL